MSARGERSSSAVIVGGEPRVSLLPPEIAARKKAAATRRAAVILVFIAVLIAAVGSGVAWLYQLEREGRLTAVNAETAALLQQQAKYNDVRAAAAVVQAADDARRSVADAEIDWNVFMTKAWDVLPDNTRILSLELATTTMIEVYAPPAAPLEPARMGAINFTVASPGVRAIKDWAIALEGLPGVVDSRPVQIVFNDTLGADTPYEGSVLITFDEGALAHRFDGVEGEDPATPAELARADLANGIIWAETFASKNGDDFTGLDAAALAENGYQPTEGFTLVVTTADATHYVLTVTATDTGDTWTYDSSTGVVIAPGETAEEEAE